MASRNPSRPLPDVRNQFRPVSDWLGYINDVETCPYNSGHVMKSHRLMRHIPKCEENAIAKSGKKDDGKSTPSGNEEKCPFNSLHRFPIGKQEEHFRTCKARAEDLLARMAAGESLDDVDCRYKF